MITKELIDEYRHLLKTDEKAAETFVEEHQDNQLFTSLVSLKNALIPAIVEVWREKGLLSDD